MWLRRLRSCRRLRYKPCRPSLACRKPAWFRRLRPCRRLRRRPCRRPIGHRRGHSRPPSLIRNSVDTRLPMRRSPQPVKSQALQAGPELSHQRRHRSGWSLGRLPLAHLGRVVRSDPQAYGSAPWKYGSLRRTRGRRRRLSRRPHRDQNRNRSRSSRVDFAHLVWCRDRKVGNSS
jgi:hypothetical protein